MVAQQQLANQAAPANAASNTAAHNRASTHDPITPMQRWAHDLVLEMLKANLPLPSLAAHLKIPFNTLIDYINLPEVRAEIDAYEELCALRARLLGQTARPVSLRRLLDVLESPTPQPTGRDPDADQRTLHRHAELIRRTATTIARESRALIPKPTSKHAPKPAPRPTPTPPVAREPQKGAPSASSGSSVPAADTRARDSAPTPSPTQPGATSSRRGPSGEKPELVQNEPTPRPSPSNAAPSGATSSRRVREPEPVLDPPTPTPTPTPTPSPSPITHGTTDSSPSSPTTSSSVSLCLGGESSSPSPSASSAALRVESSSSSSPCPSVALRGQSSSPVRALLRVCGTTRARDHPTP